MYFFFTSIYTTNIENILVQLKKNINGDISSAYLKFKEKNFKYKC